MKLGILGTADIAFRRFLPALEKNREISYHGVASRTPEKGKVFSDRFGGLVYPSYDALLSDDEIDAVYVPLPPALHYEWGKKVLESGKHLFMEKPFTTDAEKTRELISLAQEKDLAIHENYMFVYHRQLQVIREMLSKGELGELRLIRATFGFPKRAETDFRYSRSLGGGALLDCGGYPTRLVQELLGLSTTVLQAQLSSREGYEVDLYGNVVLQNGDGQCAQIAFGMDNAYRCELEIWGSRATLIASRIFTAGAGVVPTAILRSSTDETKLEFPEDDQFLHSIEHFYNSCMGKGRKESIERIERQAQLIDAIASLGRKSNSSKC